MTGFGFFGFSTFIFFGGPVCGVLQIAAFSGIKGEVMFIPETDLSDERGVKLFAEVSISDGANGVVGKEGVFLICPIEGNVIPLGKV